MRAPSSGMRTLRSPAWSITLPDAVGQPLLRLADHLADADAQAVCTAYVDTFDTTRKCALHLTYYAHGDTRKRGIALVQFKQAFRRAGLEVNDDELPDHLSVVLEFGATGSVDVAWKLLNDHRSGIELLQLGLDAKDSPWADAVTALRATLPPLDGTQAEAVARLLAEGPPNEEVGLDGYALDPRLNPHPADDDRPVLPHPHGFGEPRLRLVYRRVHGRCRRPPAGGRRPRTAAAGARAATGPRRAPAARA